MLQDAHTVWETVIPAFSVQNQHYMQVNLGQRKPTFWNAVQLPAR